LSNRASLPPAIAASNAPVHRERLIAACRVALAALSLLAVWLDPTEPVRLVGLTYWLLAAYALLAMALARWLWLARSMSPILPPLVHGVDLGVFFVLILATAGPTSPFFAFLVFALAAATVRWQAVGTLWTGLTVVGQFLVVGLAAGRLEPEGSLELNRFLIRTIYLVVLAVMLGYVGSYEKRFRSRVATLAALPPLLPAAIEGAVRALLEHATGVVHAKRAIVVWEEEEEPWCNVVSWSTAAFDWRREPPGSLEPLAPASLRDQAFLVTGPTTARQGLTVLTPAGQQRAPTLPVPQALQQSWGHASILSLPLRGETVRGRFFALDVAAATTDDIVLGEILAQQIAVQLDRLTLFERFHREGLAEERVRLASDLHDGIIQSLAGAALRLETARQLLVPDPAAANRLLEGTLDLLMSEQRELRELVGDLAMDGGHRTIAVPLGERLERLRQRIGRHWDLRVTFSELAIDGEVDDRLAGQVYSLVHEALVNASRHGQAAAADVAMTVEDREIHLAVTDDGCGFPFRGTYDFARLTALKLGPVSLKRRVSTLGGRLQIASSETGARLDIWLPLDARGGAG
jgi:signal transduction histidine kinase